MFGIMTALTCLALAGQRRFEGPLLVILAQDHGIHLGDAIPMTFWLAGVAICRRMWQMNDLSKAGCGHRQWIGRCRVARGRGNSHIR